MKIREQELTALIRILESKTLNHLDKIGTCEAIISMIILVDKGFYSYQEEIEK